MDSLQQLRLVLPAFTGMIATMRFDRDRLARLAPAGFALATDVAEWLVRQGVPFRVAHEVAGACVRECERRGIDLPDLTDQDLAAISPLLTAGVRRSWTSRFPGVPGRRGGTAPVRVAEQRARLVQRIEALRGWALRPVTPVGRAQSRVRQGETG